jgi:8-oxo-dGTP diphosphatase
VSPVIPRTVAALDWQAWEPEQRATLLFVLRGSRVLLIHKKRGLGAGKINAVGGRLDPGETPHQAALRETDEELCIQPIEVTECGDLSFQFIDGLSIFVTVYQATDYVGVPTETDEARPLWFDINQIPYDRMWADDALWVPLMLKGTGFSGRFIFDENEMLDSVLDTEV